MLPLFADRVRKKYCYLCEDLVSKYDWVSGNHRRECQKHRMHKEFLARLPAPYAAIVCPDCKEVKIKWKLKKRSRARNILNSTQAIITESRVESWCIHVCRYITVIKAWPWWIHSSLLFRDWNCGHLTEVLCTLPVMVKIAFMRDM